jgi:hypothetical protein
MALLGNQLRKNAVALTRLFRKATEPRYAAVEE